MSAKTATRKKAQGMTTKIPSGGAALRVPAAVQRNPVVRALVQRSASGGAGRHERSEGAKRRAHKVELRRQCGSNEWN